MFRSERTLNLQPARGRPPVVDLLGLAVLLGVALAFSASQVFGSATISVVVFGAIATGVGYGLSHHYPHDALGLSNATTLIRAALVAFLCGAVFAPEASAWIVFGVALVALILDGFDGWLARRSGLVSAFGARFDMETDAGLAAALSVWLLASGTTGPEILVLGFMRYAFVVASFFWATLNADLPESFRRKAICVVQISALVVLVCPLTPDPILLAVGVIAALLLTWSFLLDILWLARRAA